MFILLIRVEEYCPTNKAWRAALMSDLKFLVRHLLKKNQLQGLIEQVIGDG